MPNSRQHNGVNSGTTSKKITNTKSTKRPASVTQTGSEFSESRRVTRSSESVTRDENPRQKRPYHRKKLNPAPEPRTKRAYNRRVPIATQDKKSQAPSSAIIITPRQINRTSTNSPIPTSQEETNISNLSVNLNESVHSVIFSDHFPERMSSPIGNNRNSYSEANLTPLKEHSLENEAVELRKLLHETQLELQTLQKSSAIAKEAVKYMNDNLEHLKPKLDLNKSNRQSGTKPPPMPKMPKIHQFSGAVDEDFDMFKEDILNLISREAYSEDQKVQIVQSYLAGNAKYTFLSLPLSQRSTLEDVLVALRRVFACTTMHEWLDELEATKHQLSEDYRVYGAKITRMVMQAYPVNEMTSMAVESLKINHFLRGIQPDLAEMIRRRQPRLLDIATEMAKIHEVSLPTLKRATKRKVTFDEPLKKQQIMIMSTNEEEECQEGTAAAVGSQVKIPKQDSENCMSMTQVVQEIKNNNKQHAQKLLEIKKKMGDLETKWQSTQEHMNVLQNNYKAGDPNERKVRYPSTQTYSSDQASNKPRCHRCDSTSHFIRDCPEPPTINNRSRSERPRSEFHHHHHHHPQESKSTNRFNNSRHSSN